MVEVYDSVEQSERVKGWLRENGGAIIMGLVLAFGGLFGFKQWQVWDQNKSQRASAEYEVLLEELAEERLDPAVANFETLKADHAGSAYTHLAALSMARARVESGQGELAVSLLESVMKSGEPAPLREIARERLARLKIDLGDAEAALALIDAALTETGFESRYAEIRGDALAALGRNADAIAAYTEALERQETGIGFRPLLEMKRDALEADAGMES
ncbi:tetratricopeptide repeat protein [Marinihelvus fidelis]|uniref:Ancillary SecYEG translocon subunit n=1 Tax=Marinihelvus fidelis TaxID=2613842 RepID=A0A5N0TDV6_9GAMM|nr:tetratricopeptide repeat protein [Marinihelvus fidelis]KAA9132026.1 tetratricopeptide repeat protein [Marinihelvus fidelis]